LTGEGDPGFLIHHLCDILSCSCFYADDIGLLLKQGKNFKGKAIHTTSALADKIQDIVGASEGGKVIGGTVESTLSRCRAFKTDAEVACLLHANKVCN
jgi:hypothetical protein